MSRGDRVPHYGGAGDGQCVALKASDGERCQNGVYGHSGLCDTHKNAGDVTLAPEEDDRVWYWCSTCGFQPADYAGAGSEPFCSSCGVEMRPELGRWEDEEVTA